MPAVIFDFLMKYFPQIAGYLSVFFVGAFVIYKFAEFYIKVNGVCDNHSEIKNKLDRLMEKFNSLTTILFEKEIIKDSALFSTNSPLNLTADGIAFIEKIGWRKSIENDKNKNELFNMLDKLKLSNKYDVEKYCIIILNELNGSRIDNPFTEIKKYLYENANINEKDAVVGSAIYLRDEYLKAHPEIK